MARYFAPLEVLEEVFDVFGSAEALDGFGGGDRAEPFEKMAFDAFLPSLADPFSVVEFSAAWAELDVACGDILPIGRVVAE